MATHSQQESTPFKASQAEHARRYWRKVIEKEGEKTIAAYAQLLRRYEINMGKISSQISDEVGDSALASQIIDEYILSVYEFLEANADRIEESGGPVETLSADSPLSIGPAHDEKSRIRDLDAGLDTSPGSSDESPTKPKDPRGKRTSAQKLLGNPKTVGLKDPHGKRASTEKLPDGPKPKYIKSKLDLRAATAKSTTNDFINSTQPSTKPAVLSSLQSVKRRRTAWADPFPSPPSPNPEHLQTQPTPAPTTQGLLHWADVKNRAYIFLHTDGKYYACVCFGVHGGGRHWFREDPFASTAAGGTGSVRTRSRRGRRGGTFSRGT
ncbi:hypothetical protein B0T18DRAFT_443773 [Schizothecium vesticola]|uniref:Uncharacterized protein n=1 Tax=Schizothecium vesticola TaxID=314040 RepID=A0AA40F4Q2_9PEZI|nr:hypothetical protein B0T18DRAFT_443773 [Schizothecium vesticola]